MSGARRGERTIDSVELRSALVVGTGLLGTSVGLALRSAGVMVYLRDSDPAAAAFAADLGAGSLAAPPAAVAVPGAVAVAVHDVVAVLGAVDVAVVAVAPGSTGSVVADLLTEGVARHVTDVASVKGAPMREVLRRAPAHAARYCGGHPMAGRERSGPGAARSDLFVGRPWVLAPHAQSSSESLGMARAVALACQAVPVVMDVEAHDRAVAVISHVPQVAASLVASALLDSPDDVARIAGPGFRDVTRIAASDPGLWTEILAANALEVAAVLDDMALDLGRLREALHGLARDQRDEACRTTVAGVIAAGVQGRRRIPGKHGQQPVSWDVVPVIIGDARGELARLFTEADAEGINVEDIGIEHSPGQQVGLVEISVAPGAGAGFATALRERGWTVHEPTMALPG